MLIQHPHGARSGSFAKKLEEMTFEDKKDELCNKPEKKRERRKSAGEPSTTEKEAFAIKQKQSGLETERKLLLNQLKEIEADREKNKKLLLSLQAKNADLVCENDILCDRVADLMIQNKNLHNLQKENTELRRENQELSARVTSLKRLSRCIDRANDKYRGDITELRQRPSIADYQAVNSTVRTLRLVVFILLISFFSMIAHVTGMFNWEFQQDGIDSNFLWSFMSSSFENC
ncbi:uncharacterized protein LOC117120413 isoform X2 [Anneissia japonica]|uniref:uncharacterized protein LOC117120413 isoform X2 n=1 Tax=Anneissia japonica TaxID=1529436 RepID=UPI00142574E3|nr:uncharacterized protein LOC117120413 isoform X2 [Anneissia japonica]